MDEKLTLEVITGLYEAEYLSLLSTYESYNDQSLIIKGWSVTIGMAAILSCYRFKPGEAPGRFAVIISALVVLPFWMMDALWKALQTGYKIRLERIEAVIAEISAKGLLRLTENDAPLQSMATWKAHWTRSDVFGEFLGSLFTSTVCLPHIFVLFGGLALAWFHPPSISRKIPV